MPNHVKSKVAKAAKDIAPWREGISWWVVLFQGIALLALGLFMFFNDSVAKVLIGWGIGLALAVSGAAGLYLAQQATEQTPARKWTLYHGATGLAAGAVIILMMLTRATISTGTMLWLGGLGCLAYGAVGLAILLNKELTRLRRVSIVSTVFYLIIGILLILQAVGVGTLQTTLSFVNMGIIIGGIVLILWAFILRNDPNN